MGANWCIKWGFFVKKYCPERGYNRYGHPAAETIARFTNSGTKIFNTKESGAIITTVNTDGSMVVETYKNNKYYLMPGWVGIRKIENVFVDIYTTPR